MLNGNVSIISSKTKYSVITVKRRGAQILSLSFPMILAVIGRVIMNLIDTAMVGALGSHAIAGVNLSIFTSSLVTDFLIAIGAAVLALTARRLGENRKSQTKEILAESISIALSIGIPLSILGGFTASRILPLINNDLEVINQGKNYLMIISSGWFLIMLFYAFQGYYDGIGRPSVYLINILVVVNVNVALNYCLIQGKYFFPALGTTGAAIATISAYFFGVIVFILIHMSESKSFVLFNRCKNPTTRKENRKKLSKLFVSIGAQNLAIISGFFVFVTLSSRISVQAMAITGILLQLSNTLVLLANAFGRTAGSLAGQALGAKESRKALKSGMETSTVGLLCLMPIFIIFIFAPEFVMSIFISEPDMIIASVPILQILGGGMIFDVFATILMNTMLGAGWVRSIVIWNIIGIWIVFIPLAIVDVFYFHFSVLGFWTSLFIYRILVGIVFVFEYKRKKWLKKNL